jgi:hypothetical protein
MGKVNLLVAVLNCIEPNFAPSFAKCCVLAMLATSKAPGQTKLYLLIGCAFNMTVLAD